MSVGSVAEWRAKVAGKKAGSDNPKLSPALLDAL
jgi:hypothetical protein